MTLSPSNIVGGQSTVGTATLECRAGPGPITVDLSSTNPAVASPVAASIVVPQSTQSASFDVVTSPVLVKSSAVIAGATNGTQKSRNLTLTAAAVVSATSLKFGSVPTGQASAPLNTTLTNKGAAAFSVDSISVTGTGNSVRAEQQLSGEFASRSLLHDCDDI